MKPEADRPGVTDKLRFMASRRRFLGMTAAGGALAATVQGGSFVAMGQDSPATCPDPGATSDLPDEIIIGSLGDPPNSNPILATATDGIFRAHLMFDSLVGLDGATLQPIPRLAKSWTVSPDGLSYVFDLVDNATWHDGQPVTAEDVEFTAYGILHPDYTGPYRSSWAVLEGAEAVISGEADQIPAIVVENPHRISFKLAQPYAPFLALGAARMMVIPKHLLQDVSPADLLESEFEQAPVGSGPFTFVSYTRNADFVVEANESYWGGVPAIKRVISRVIPDSQSLAIALETGEMHGSLYALPSQADRLREQPNLEVISAPFSYPDALVFHMDDPVVGNKAVRQAISIGVDTETFAQEFLAGLGEPGAGPVAPSMWAYNEAIQPNRYDPTRAREILEQDGWLRGDDGVYAKEGQRAAFTFLTNQGNVMREDFGTFIQAQLQEVGIEAVPEFIEFSLLITRFNGGDFPTAFDGFVGARVDPDELYDQFHTEGAVNNQNYSSPALDELLVAGRASVDQAERKEIYARVQEMLIEDLPAFWAWYRPFVHVVDKDYAGPWIVPTTLTDGIFWNLQKWGTCA